MSDLTTQVWEVLYFGGSNHALNVFFGVFALGFAAGEFFNSEGDL